MDPHISKSTPVDKIREILFPGELKRIQSHLDELDVRLKHLASFEHSTETLAKIFPEAVSASVEARPQPMAQAFAPLVGEAITAQVRDEKEKIVDALYPVIGATISKYMAKALKEVKESVNSRIEEKFSINSFFRKIKSKALGISEADLLLEQSLNSEFQNLFLIHKTSGLLVAETHQEWSSGKDADMVAGMLSAISSFVEDWISQSHDNMNLDSIDYGQYTILFEQSSRYVLAGVVKGGDPDLMRKPLQVLLESLLTKFSSPLNAFSGQSGVMPKSVVDKIESAIDIQGFKKNREKKKKRNNRVMIILAGVLGLLLLYGFAKGAYYSYHLRKIEGVVNSDPILKNYPLDYNLTNGIFSARGVVEEVAVSDRLKNIAKTHYGDSVRFDFSKLKVLSLKKWADIKVTLQKKMESFKAKIAPGLTWSLKDDGNVLLGGLLTKAQEDDVEDQLLSDPGVVQVLSEAFRLPEDETQVSLGKFQFGQSVLETNEFNRIKSYILAQPPKGKLKYIDFIYMHDKSDSLKVNERIYRKRKENLSRRLKQAFASQFELNIRWIDVTATESAKIGAFNKIYTPSVITIKRDL